MGRVAQRIADLLSEVVGTSSPGLLSLLRRAPGRSSTVQVSWQEGSPRDLALQPLSYQVLKEEPGSFELPENGLVRVYRRPSVVSVGFKLSFPTASQDDDRLAAFDRIQNFFFDSRALPAVVPTGLLGTALGRHLEQLPAELTLTGLSLQPLSASLEYRGPFHSGTVLREDKRVTHRDLRMSRMGDERSSKP